MLHEMSTGVLREGGSPHVVEDIFAASTETGGSIGHLTFSLGIADFATQIGLSTLLVSLLSFVISDLAEFAFSALRSVERNDMIPNLDIGDSFTDRLDDSTTLVSADNRESAF